MQTFDTSTIRCSQLHWLKPDPSAPIDNLTTDQLIAAHEAMLAEVTARHRSNLFYPLQIPDLIGVKDRYYLDHTGLQKHRSIGDLMRYAALNQGADDLASYDGFVPCQTFTYSTKRPELRRSDRPSAVDIVTSSFMHWRCTCTLSNHLPIRTSSMHSPTAARRYLRARVVEPVTRLLFYTNNKLTPGRRLPCALPRARTQFDIAPFSVGTDPNMTLKTRRGTGYYKVPSLKGVWYRSMFGHSGWCASLEDWFDPKRLEDDHQPTGFKPFGAQSYAVKGHPFGLDLSEEDRRALIAFLKTL